MTREKLTEDILEFCKKHGISRRTFGTMAMNEPFFVYGLQRGRDIRMGTAEKLVKFMKDYKKSAKAGA